MRADPTTKGNNALHNQVEVRINKTNIGDCKAEINKLGLTYLICT